MKKLINISLALMVLTFAACKKNNTDIVPVPNTVVPKLKTFTIMNGATTLNTIAYEYDNTGRLVKNNFMDGSKYTYTYTGAVLLLETFLPNGTSQNKYTYTLNAEGLAESYYNNATATNIGYQFFNAAKQLTLETTKTNGVLTFQKYHEYDIAGNNLKDSVVQANGVTIRTYEYYTDIISTITNINIGDYYDGVGNKNCVKKQTSKSPLNVITITTYTVPELDAQGRVIKQSYTSGTTTTDYLYTYY